MSTICYISNRAHRKGLAKTPCELYNSRKPNVSHLKVFGSKCYIHNNGKTNLGNFDPKTDVGIFIGYSNISKTYKVFNKKTQTVEESIHIVFDKIPYNKKNVSNEDDDSSNVFKPIYQ